MEIGDVLDEEDVMRTLLISRLHSSVLLPLVLAGLTIGTPCRGRRRLRDRGRVGGNAGAEAVARSGHHGRQRDRGRRRSSGARAEDRRGRLKGDVAFAETVLSSDFHFRHGDGWTRGEKTGGTEDDRAAFMKRIADKEYLVHDLDNPKIEMHGDVAITWGRYVSLFVPKNRNNANPPRLTTIWFERVWAKRDGRWQWLSHRTVWGPHPSPAGVDPTQVAESRRATLRVCRPRRPRRQRTEPESKEAAEMLDIEIKLGAAVPGGDSRVLRRHTTSDFLMWHGDIGREAAGRT